MALGLHARNQRRSPRIDVLLRVNGELVPADFEITIANISRTGFALISPAMFRAGDRLNFRLTPKKGAAVLVTAAAVHSQSLPDSPGRFLTGFTFEPEGPGGTLPDDAIRELIAAVAPVGFKI